MSSSASKLHHCPHECGCVYASKKLSHVKRHAWTNHWDCNPECPSHDLHTQRIARVETPDSTAVKRAKRRKQATVQERQEPQTFEEPTAPNPKLRRRHGRVVDFSIDDEVTVAGSGEEHSGSNYRNCDSNDEESDSSDPDPPPSQTKRDSSGTTSQAPKRFAHAFFNLSPSPESMTKPGRKFLLRKPMPKAIASSSKRASQSSQPNALAPTRPATPAEPVPQSIGLSLPPNLIRKQPSRSQPPPPNTTSIPSDAPFDPLHPTKSKTTGKATSQPTFGKETPAEKTVRDQPTDLPDVAGFPDLDDLMAGRVPEPNQNRTPAEPGDQPGSPLTESPPAQSTHSSPEPDIESLYASPSPEKTVTELVPIELDSEPDFEMMERTLLSHRGPLSQPLLLKGEPTAQPLVLSQANRTLKRQRSHPSPDEFSQAPIQTPQVDSKPAKRPRVNGPRSSNSTVVLNDRRKHPEFWDLDGTVVLQVDDVLFRVMRSTLSKASPWFQRLFSEEFDHLEIMAGCPVYIIEEDFSHLDFANLLRGLENGL